MSTTALAFRNLHKTFDKTAVLRGIDASVERGEVIGLLGLNGAGKTTLLETALGFSLPQQGSAEVFGQDSRDLDVATRLRIGFVPQQDELVDGMKAGAYLGLIAAFYAAWNHGLVERLAGEWNVPLDRKISALSVGQRQKLSIIAALGSEPDLLVLDEPVASLDPVARRQFLKELVDIASSQSRTIVFSTHIVSDLERVASRVWLLKDGAIAVDGSLDELKEGYVRVHLPPLATAPADLRAEGLLHRRDGAAGTVLMFASWSDERRAALERAVGSDVRVETLSLEELFLELHA